MGSSASSARRRSQGDKQTPVYDRSKPTTPRGAQYRAGHEFPGRPPNASCAPCGAPLPVSHISGVPPQTQTDSLEKPLPPLPPKQRDTQSYDVPNPSQAFPRPPSTQLPAIGSGHASGSQYSTSLADDAFELQQAPVKPRTSQPHEQRGEPYADSHTPQAFHVPNNPARPQAQPQTRAHGRVQGHMQNPQESMAEGVNAPINNVQHVGLGNFGINLGTQTYTAHYTSDVLWESLPRQRDTSGHRSVYLGGSRDEDVKKIRAWVEAPSSELTLWIYGPAGVGKSTLAREVCHDLREADLLAAFVPLSSLPSDAQGPESVIKMIAREIGETHPRAAPAITEAISQSKGSPVRTHLNNFVGEPLRTLRRPSPVVVVLDAFDEWKFADILIKDLDCLAPLSSIVRFILLGRSDPRSLGHENAFTRPYLLQPVSQEVMEKYFAREFEGVKWDHGRKPSARDVSHLAEQAGGLFIWASIACSLVGKGLDLTSPNKTLEGILYSREKFGENGHLGTLYGGALQRLFPGEDEQAALKQYLGMILILQEPLPLDDFSFFSGLPSRSVHAIQIRLGALQIRNTSDGQHTVHPATSSFHLSFVEYIQHAATPQSTSFATPSGSAHSGLAKACLWALTAPLPTSHGLSQRQWYAVKHWVLHTSEGAPAVKPGSSSDWEATELCSVLNGISMITWHWWRNVILGFFIPGYDVGEVSGGNSVSDFLRDVAQRLDDRNLAMIPFRIACLSVATHLQPDGVYYGWCDLGWAYLIFAEVSSSSKLLHQAVTTYETAVTAGGSSNPAVMTGLGIALKIRFTRLGVMPDLDRSILLIEKALALCPSGHPNRPSSLCNLAISLKSRFKVTNSLDDLQEAIILQKEVLTLRPSGHPHRSSSLSNLANSLSSRFSVTKLLDDLQEAIVLHKEALALCPSGHPGHSTSLCNLAISLSSRFGVTNSLDDLQKAIVLQKEALTLRPSGHPDRSSSLFNLAASLHSQFKVKHSFDDLREAITLFREALVLCPPGHVDRFGTLRNLADALESCSRVTGSAEDMHEACTLRQELDAPRPQ